MNKFFKAFFLLLIAMPAFNNLKAMDQAEGMDNGWKILSVGANAFLIAVLRDEKKLLSQENMIGATIGAIPVSLLYYHTNRRYAHQRNDLHHRIRMRQEQVDAGIENAVIPADANDAYLPSDPNMAISALERAEKILDREVKTNNQIFLFCMLPCSAAIGIASWRLIHAVMQQRAEKEVL